MTRRRSAAMAAGLSAAIMVVAGAIAPAGAAEQQAACDGYVGLTFDDGPSRDNTPRLLDALRENGLRATMFNEGRYAAAYPDQVQAEVAAGMWVGNHSYTHPHLRGLSRSEIESEISRTQRAIAGAGGGTPELFRPPYGETSGLVRSVESELGLTEVLWDVDSQDWNGASVDQIVRASASLTDGQVILMHEWPRNTIDAIPRIADVLADRGLCSGRISPRTGDAVAP